MPLALSQKQQETKTKTEREREKSFCGRLSVWLLCVSRPACPYYVQELYKIPKKQRAEERKRTERELGGWFLSSHPGQPASLTLHCTKVVVSIDVLGSCLL